jgi:cytochrome c-type biogenesis protein CcmE
VTEAARRRWFAVGALAVAGGALGWISMGDLGDDLVYYWSPSELVSKAEAREATVRLGGLVVPGSLNWNREQGRATFQVTDGSTTVSVDCDGNPPQMFREGVGVVVEGRLGGDDVFRTSRVMVKHSNEYQAPADGHPPDIARTLDPET